MQFAGIVLRVSIIFHGILYVISGTLAFETIITRDHQDIFQIPQEMCWDDIEKQCNSMGGKQRVDGTNYKVPCTCQCDYNSINNVFGRFDNQWKCGTNFAVRNLAEQKCSGQLNLFNGIKSYDAPLESVEPKENHNEYIGGFTTSFSACSIDSQFQYLDCWNSWQSYYGSLFGIYRNHVYSTALLTFWLNHIEQIRSKRYLRRYGYTAVTYGRIIKLKINCWHEYKRASFCLLFKVEEKLNCAVIYPTSPPVVTTTASVTTTKTKIATAKKSTAMPSTTTTTKPPLSTSLATTHSTAGTSTESSTTSFFNQSYSTNIPTTAETKKINPTTEHQKPTNRTGIKLKKRDRDKRKDDNSSISGIIAGVVGGLIGLITVLLILVILWIKKKRNSPNKAARQESVNNAVYDGVILDNRSQQPPGQHPGDVEYSYAYMSTHPIVIRDQNGTEIPAPNMKTNSNSPIYNTLEDPDYAKLKTANETSYNVLARKPEAGWKTPSSSESPVYNTLEDQSYAKINKTGKKQQREPSYNVLERGPAAKQNEPFYDALEKPKSALKVAKTSEAPIYNTLEDPNYAAPETTEDSRNNQKDKATRENPIYNVLEGPNSTHDSPIYNVLEGPSSSQKSPIYNVLEGPMASSPVYDEVEQPESDHEYNYAGDVIYQNDVKAVDSDVYQQLNQDRQSSMEEQYEPLRHSNMFIAMQDMNGEEQSHA